MPVVSSIKTLPEPVLAEVNAALAAGRLTLDDITVMLAEAGHPRSRSALGRYKKQLDRVGAQLRQSREITEALVAELGPAAGDGKQGRLLVEILRKIVMDQLVDRLDDEGGGLEPRDVMFLGRALKELSQSTRLDQDFDVKIRDQVAKEEQRKAVKIIDEAAKTPEVGLSRDTADGIKARILGVKPGPGHAV